MDSRSALTLLLLSLLSCKESTEDATSHSPEEWGVQDSRGLDAGEEQGDVRELTDASASYQIRVEGAFASAEHLQAGEPLHLWATLDPYTERLEAWEGIEGREWHLELPMPSQDLEIRTRLRPSELRLSSQVVQGVAEPKTLLYAIPPEPRGVIGLFHGTNGSRHIIEKAEGIAIASAVYARGYVIFATDSEQTQTEVDPNEDGKLRWQVDLEPDNPDLENLRIIFAALEQEANLPEGSPRYALGMSNGGAFSLLLGLSDLGFRAVASHCASGRESHAEETQTPTLWALCAQDGNPQVDNEKAQRNHERLLARSIASQLWIHPPTPLYEGRFARVEGIDLETSTLMVEELRRAEALDEVGMLRFNPDEIAAWIQERPEEFPGLSVLPGTQRRGALSQLKILWADHELYSDYIEATLNFFEAQP